MADRPMLDAVVFDAGGTLVRLDFEFMSSVVREYGHPVDTATLRHGEVAGRRRYDASGRRGHGASPPLGGRGDVRDYFGGMLMAVGVPAHSIEAIIVRFMARERASGLWSRPNEGARATLDALAARGVRRCVVSNSDGRAEHHLKASGVRDGLEFVVDSTLVGIEKPAPGIFHVALDQLGLPPARTLYVGDIRSVDEAGAQAAGMHFVLIDPHGDYAAAGTPSIASIAELPSWLDQHFVLVDGRDVAAAFTPAGSGA